MTARESIENLWDRAAPVAPLLDQYAHELAEKIRAERYIHDCCPECHAAADACANLIDPEEESTR